MEHKKWEYKVDIHSGSLTGDEYLEYLNKRGQNGWQLCDTRQGSDPKPFLIFTFKRPLLSQQ